MRNWVQSACDDVLRLRNRAGLWGYRSDRRSSVEATSLACLGLLCCREAAPSQEAASAVKRGAEWLATLQQADGSLGVCASLPQPGWATPYAILLWSALDTLAPERQRAAAWLLAQKGLRPPASDNTRIPVGHNPMLVGWPWIEKTHSWLEPTAMAILALNRLSLHDRARVDEGMLIITDRALSHGGWNPGGKAVFGRELRPQPGPTGIAMLALATRATNGRPREVDQAITFLRQALPSVRAPISLGWGVLGLRAWNAAPVDAQEWLSRSHALVAGRRDSAVGLGLLLLAGGERALEFFGSRATQQITRSAAGVSSDRRQNRQAATRLHEVVDVFRGYQE
jgi:hypothetical protein